MSIIGLLLNQSMIVNKFQKMKCRIALMDMHFLYLPILFAAHKGFYGRIPKEYDLSCDVSATKTDVFTMQSLLSNTDIHKDILFAVCDPLALFSNQIPKNLVFNQL